MEKPESITVSGRRNFLRLLSFLGISGIVSPRRGIAGLLLTNSRVIITTDSHATSGGTINSSVVQIMINRGIQSLAQIDDVGLAWKSLLSGIAVSSKIALKVNCINSSCSTHPPVAYAVANSLKQMMFGSVSFPENNIIIFDRTQYELQAGGYTINTGATGVRCFATDSAGVGYSTQTYNVNGSTQRLSKIITDTCDYLINISVLKNHSDSGVTLCLKNHYGTCNSPGNLHGNNCDPYVPALNAIPVIKAKQKVFITDALFGIRSGGPGGPPQFVTNKLIMSTDIVATDYWGRRVLQENGCTTTGQAHHIDTAATTYTLGTNNPNQMDVVTIQDPSGVAEEGGTPPAGFVLHQNYPNPFNPRTRIRFEIPRSTNLTLRIVDDAGKTITTLAESVLPAGSHTVVFDAANLPSGAYFYQLKTPEIVLTKKLLVLK